MRKSAATSPKARRNFTVLWPRWTTTPQSAAIPPLTMDNQSFNVDDIRRVREEMSERWSKMTHEEICDELAEATKRAHREMAEVRRREARTAAMNSARASRTAAPSPPPAR